MIQLTIPTGRIKSGRKTTDSVIDSEVQILTSWDLAAQVAEAIGPKRLGASSNAAAAGSIVSGLQVGASKGSDVIVVSYTNADPQLAPLVLQELLSRYFVKHLEVHRSAGAFDFVTQQTDQVRARLNQTEDALNTLRNKIGIVSTLQDGQKAIAEEAADAQKQLNAAEADLAEQQALVKQIGEKKANSWTSRKSRSDKTPGASLLAGKQAKLEALKTRLRDIQQRIKQLSELRPRIEELERKREMDENNYKYFAASLEKRAWTRLWILRRCPTSARSNGPLLLHWIPKTGQDFSGYCRRRYSLGYSSCLIQGASPEPDHRPATGA